MRIAKSKMENKAIIHREEVPKLSKIALLKVAKNFLDFTDLEGVPYHFKEQIYSNTSTDLPLDLTFKTISDQQYWKRATLARFPSANVQIHGNCWKQCFAEHHIQSVLDNFEDDTDGDAFEDLKIESRIFKLHIFTLEIRYLSTNESLINYLLQVFPNLSHLTLKYSPKLLKKDNKLIVQKEITRLALNSH